MTSQRIPAGKGQSHLRLTLSVGIGKVVMDNRFRHIFERECLFMSYHLSARGAVPALDIRTDGLKSFNADEPIDTLVVAVFQGQWSRARRYSGEVLSSQQEIALWKLLTAVGAVGKKGEVTTVPGEVLSGSDADGTSEGAASTPAVERILAVGLGDIEEVTDETIREAAGVASRSVKRPNASADENEAEAPAVERTWSAPWACSAQKLRSWGTGWVRIPTSDKSRETRRWNELPS